MRAQPSPPRVKGAFGIFGAPLLLALLSASGLFFALIGDGTWDAASWACLGVPVAVIVWFVLRPAGAP